MEMVGIGDDKTLIDRVFWVFDEEGKGRIGFRELGIGLEMLNSNTFEDKLDTFFDLCDEDNSDTIDKKEFYNLLRITIATSYEDREKIKELVNQVFNSSCPSPLKSVASVLPQLQRGTTTIV